MREEGLEDNSSTKFVEGRWWARVWLEGSTVAAGVFTHLTTLKFASRKL